MPLSGPTAMSLVEDLRDTVDAGLHERGYAHVVGPLDEGDYRDLAEALGQVVGVERIALRADAHAYVAKPGPVPLHTDQPEVEIIGWHCIRQDEHDGASLLLDTWPVVNALDEELRATLQEVLLVTPSLQGGPPSMTWPVLKRAERGDAVFCSPWLRSAVPLREHEEALERFRLRLTDAIRTARISIRLAPGDALMVDNGRVLHGRGAIGIDSRRCLLRVWARRRRVAVASAATAAE